MHPPPVVHRTEGLQTLKLPMTLDDADEQQRLPLHHRDPFDQLLVAQAKTNGLVVVSIDQAFDLYGVPRIW